MNTLNLLTILLINSTEMLDNYVCNHIIIPKDNQFSIKWKHLLDSLSVNIAYLTKTPIGSDSVKLF